MTTAPVLLIKLALPLPEVATARSRARPEIFWIVAELLIWMVPLSRGRGDAAGSALGRAGEHVDSWSYQFRRSSSGCRCRCWR